MAKDWGVYWTKESQMALNKLINDTVELGEDSLKVCIVTGVHFCRFAERRTKIGKKKVFRKVKIEGPNKYMWITPTDSRQTEWQIERTKKGFTPRGLGWHKKTWKGNIAKMRKYAGKYASAVGRTNAPQWARKRGDVDVDIKNFWEIMTVRHFGPAIAAMDSGGNGLKARGIMGYALKKASGKQKQFLWMKKRELEGMWR